MAATVVACSSSRPCSRECNEVLSSSSTWLSAWASTSRSTCLACSSQCPKSSRCRSSRVPRDWVSTFLSTRLVCSSSCTLSSRRMSSRTPRARASSCARTSCCSSSRVSPNWRSRLRTAGACSRMARESSCTFDHRPRSSCRRWSIPADRCSERRSKACICDLCSEAAVCSVPLTEAASSSWEAKRCRRSETDSALTGRMARETADRAALPASLSTASSRARSAVSSSVLRASASCSPALRRELICTSSAASASDSDLRRPASSARRERSASESRVQARPSTDASAAAATVRISQRSACSRPRRASSRWRPESLRALASTSRARRQRSSPSSCA
mmetsp:Transcript_53669/g.96474  ORF Transcript_53669/g.96474 Transcript_53669/m.96474 type:complete len:334 (+) Transcript_53669:430-1431(+)